MVPMNSYSEALKMFLRYLKGSPALGNWYTRDAKFDLTGYLDAYCTVYKDDRKGPTGSCHSLEGN